MQTRRFAASLATAALLLVGAASCGSDSDGGASTDQTTTSVTDSGASTDSTTTSVTDGGASTDSTTAPSPEGRPSDEQISAAIVKGFNVSQERGDCAAPKISASDLPEASLQSIATNDPGFVSEAELEDIKKVLSDALGACP